MTGVREMRAKPRSREGFDLEALARIAVDQAYGIHRALGPGLLESVYETVLCGALERAGMLVERQRPVNIDYDGLFFADAFRVDLLIENRLIIEIKSVEALARVHMKQTLTYLRLLQQPLGLVINFGAATFKEGVRRVVNNHSDFATSRLRVHNEARQ